MRNHKLLAFALALCLGFTALSCVDMPPTEPRADSALQEVARSGPLFAGGLDAELARLAEEVPGFGGMFYDASGRMNVFMTDARQQARAFQDDLRRELARSLDRAVPLREQAVRAAPVAVVRQGKYDFRQLARWHQDMLPILGLDGVVFTDIDESQNRLRVGIEPGTDWAAIEATLSGLGVPSEAVTTVLSGPITPLAGTLQDVQRPRAGGPQIVFEVPGVGFFVCTLGFNVLRDAPGRSEPFFVTNSHCSATQAEVTGTEYFQALPEVFGGHAREFVGVEVLDPSFLTCNVLIAPDVVIPLPCRFSDALLARYDRRNPVNFGAIYRTAAMGTGASAGSIELADEGGRFFSIRGEIPFPQLNDVVSKVGRTTGWTEGPVILTCGNFLVGGIVMLCQDVVQALALGGDSGSPVFTRIGNSRNVQLNGVVWGAGELGDGTPILVFSPMENIRFELGDFATH